MLRWASGGWSLMGKRGVHVPQRIPERPPKTIMGSLRWSRSSWSTWGARGYSPATIRARRPVPGRVVGVARRPRGDPSGGGHQTDAGQVSAAPVPLPSKPNGEPLSFRSQNAQLLPVRAFFKWAVRNDHVGSNPASDLELPKVEKRLPKAALTIEEAETVLSLPDLSTATGGAGPSDDRRPSTAPASAAVSSPA